MAQGSSGCSQIPIKNPRKLSCRYRVKRADTSRIRTLPSYCHHFKLYHYRRSSVSFQTNTHLVACKNSHRKCRRTAASSKPIPLFSNRDVQLAEATRVSAHTFIYSAALHMPCWGRKKSATPHPVLVPVGDQTGFSLKHHYITL